ncbi:MAG: ATP-binding protein [Elusimicrobiota bacterium]|jgi:signal transduction histidine kinase
MPRNEGESLDLLLEAGNLLSSKLDLRELLPIVMELASRVVDAETASLLLLDAKTEELYFDVALGLDPEVAKIRLKKGQGIAGACAADGKPVIVNDVAHDPRWAKVIDQSSGFKTQSVLCAPIILKGKLLGVVEAINSNTGTFTDTDVRIFNAFASQTAVAIENARLFAALSEEKAKLDTLLDEIADAAVLSDRAGRILLANAAAKKLFSGEKGSAPADVFAATRGMSACPPLGNLLEGESQAVPFEIVRKDPQLLILAGTVSAIQTEGPDGEKRECRVFVFRDVTELRREEGLKRNFLSLISHKLKTPLVTVVGYGSLLADELKDKVPADSLKALHTIRQQGSKLANLVEKLLNYTTLEDLDTRMLDAEPFPVDEVLTAAVKDLDVWLKDNDGAALVEAGSGLQAMGDSLLIKDAVKNLVENGVKFAPREKRKVALWAVQGKDRTIELNVRDTGPGIPPEEREKVFRRFYQIESSFTGQVDGWGLGLSFVKKVVEKHGGEVRIDSRPGAGTTMTLVLPQAES